jgi:hypothetical protein
MRGDDLAAVRARDRERRMAARFPASLRARGCHGAPIRVLDISITGFKALVEVRLYVGDLVWLTLPGLEPRQASVIWTEMYQLGCRFAEPLHQAVLETLLDRLKLPR